MLNLAGRGPLEKKQRHDLLRSSGLEYCRTQPTGNAMEIDILVSSSFLGSDSWLGAGRCG